MTDFFKPEDFLFHYVVDLNCMAEKCAYNANAKLKAHIETLPVVYGKQRSADISQFSRHDSHYYWHEYPMTKENSREPDTHRAVLWGVEEIKPKVCEHKEFVNYEFRSDKGIICTCICGAKLSPNHWKEVE